jgi:hypothetical protein
MKVIKFLSIIITISMAIIYISVIYDIHFNPSEYEQIYRIRGDAENWAERNITNFLIKHYIYVGLFVSGFVVNFISIYKNNKWLDKICFVIFSIIIFYLVYSPIMYFSDRYGH